MRGLLLFFFHWFFQFHLYKVLIEGKHWQSLTESRLVNINVQDDRNYKSGNRSCLSLPPTLSLNTTVTHNHIALRRVLIVHCFVETVTLSRKVLGKCEQLNDPTNHGNHPVCNIHLILYYIFLWATPIFTY